MYVQRLPMDYGWRRAESDVLDASHPCHRPHREPLML